MPKNVGNGRRYSPKQKLELIDPVLGRDIQTLRREAGVSRSTLCRWKQKLEIEGLSALINEAPAKGGRPCAVSAELEALILDVSRANPSWGCKRLSSYLKMLGVSLSSPTLQKVLIQLGRGRVGDRLAAPSE